MYHVEEDKLKMEKVIFSLELIFDEKCWSFLCRVFSELLDDLSSRLSGGGGGVPDIVLRVWTNQADSKQRKITETLLNYFRPNF